ncbi:hypothetical protein ASD79_08615 [Caulobacter sp. Root655]|uniref:hypothetical protein n=1 Tax=Caulobacter sp. Root655 TaxID=1736578 RepID=UPI0006FE5D41|nr:hypothetical protein [Caulobacter sp. Root655]KRA60287.1 hypothetical protein ASD79_08615 [Caulobacter sp. Root655]
MGLRTSSLIAAVVVIMAGPALAGDIVRKPDLSVWGNDGRFQGYSAALPLDLSTDGEKATFVAKVAGNLDSPTYDFNLDLAAKTEQGPSPRALALGASWNQREAGVRSSMSRLFGFGFMPRTNYVSVSVDMNAVAPVDVTKRAAPVTRANLRSALTLDGRQVGSIALGGGTTGEEGFDVSLTRPFDIPAEFTVSLRTADERIQDGRLMVKLVRTTW